MEWLAQLLQHGLLKPSFIPAAPQRAMRDLVRYRTQLIQERSREINRLQKVLEDANLKLGSVVSGQEDPATLAQLARGRMRSKIEELQQALTGRSQDYHRLMLKLHLEHIDDLSAKIEPFSHEVERYTLV